MDHRTEILEAKNLYCSLTGLAPATVATKAVNDGKFFDRLESGGDITSRMHKKVMTWFKEHTPKKKRQNGHD
jgi:hypothetical protein